MPNKILNSLKACIAAAVLETEYIMLLLTKFVVLAWFAAAMVKAIFFL